MSILFVNINVFYVYIIVSIVVLVSDRFVVFNFGVSEFFDNFLIQKKNIQIDYSIGELFNDRRMLKSKGMNVFN